VIERGLDLRGPLDLRATLGPLAHGRGDRTIRLARGEAWLAFHTPQGPATLRLRLSLPMRLGASAWGQAPSMPSMGPRFSSARRIGPRHSPPSIRSSAASSERTPASPATDPSVFHALLPAVLEQKVTGTEAFRAYAALLRHHGEPAPGPGDLRLPPAPATLAACRITPSTRSGSSGGEPT
jgi:hypothetical protein